MTSSWGSSFEAFTARLAQMSEAFSASFNSLGRPGPVELPEPNQTNPSEPNERSGLDDDKDDDGNNSSQEGGDQQKEVKEATETSGDRLQALKTELARRGLGSGPPPAPSPDQLSIIAEEREDLESQRSLANSRCSDGLSAGKNFTEGWRRCGRSD